MAASADACDPTSSSTVRRSTPCFFAYWFASATLWALRPAVSRMLAYTVWPARGRARAPRAPKPLEAPVMTMTDFMGSSQMARRNSVDSDVSASQFIGKNPHQAFHARFGSDVWTVGRECPGDDAAGESDDSTARRNALGRLPQYQKSAAEVGGDHLVEHLKIE